MDCGYDIGAYTLEFFNRFFLKVNQSRIPIAGAIELTARCNLNCVHCYLPAHLRRGKGDRKELSAARWMDLIDQISAAGCLFLLMTGGETLLRHDFAEIYTHACRRGLLTTVFTNGTMVSDRIIDVFHEFPPRGIEISLYGTTADTYEKITGIAGSYEKCMAGIHRLIDHGFRVKLKTMLLNINRHEIEDMEALAERLGAPFRFDALVSPCLDGDPAPIQYRVSPDRAVAMEFSNPKRAKELHDFFYRMNTGRMSTDLYPCTAGLNMFYIDASGRMRPCLMVTTVQRDLSGKHFSEIWESDAFKGFRSREQAPVSCRQCEDRVICGYCPGLFNLESGSEFIFSEFVCAMGRERKQAILNMEMEENGNDARLSQTA